MKGMLTLKDKISSNFHFKMPIGGPVLLLLCTLDALFTDFGIRNHHISEANPMMNWIYTNSILGFYGMKILLPLLLVWILRKIQPTMLIKLLMNTAVYLYCMILILHFTWLGMIVTSIL